MKTEGKWQGGGQGDFEKPLISRTSGIFFLGPREDTREAGGGFERKERQLQIKMRRYQQLLTLALLGDFLAFMPTPTPIQIQVAPPAGWSTESFKCRMQGLLV